MIELRAVDKEYEGPRSGAVKALRGIDLSLSEGEFATVTGPSGSGKSTLLFTIGGLQQPTRGTVIVAGTKPYLLSASDRARFRRRSIGFVFQSFNLVPYLNCLENVVLPAVMDGVRYGAAARRAGALLERLGMSHRVGHRPYALSVGERQRVAVARGLINRPSVLLADEPTGNLDGETTRTVVDLLLELNEEGQCIVMATHDKSLAEIGTRVLGIRDARLVTDRMTRAAGDA